MTNKINLPTQSQNTKTNLNFSLLTQTAIVGIAMWPASLQANERIKVNQLPTVTVIDSQSNNRYNPVESLNHKFTQPLVDTPKTVTVVSRQLMDDQGISKVSDALRNVPGISLAAGEGGNQGDNLMIRGFNARNDFFVDGMRDFGNYFRDAFNLESLEVVQGPSSMVFGRGSSGGAVVQNSKQAFLGSKKAGTIALGTNDLARATVDVNEKIGDHSAFRVNAMANTNKVSERDYAQYRRTGFAPSLAFGIGTKTRFNLNYFHQVEDNIPDYGIPFRNGEPADVNRNNFYGFKSNDHLKTSTNIATAKFEHDFSNDLSLRNQTRYARYYRDVAITEPQSNSTTTSDVTRSMKIRESVETYIGNQTDLTGKFSTAGVHHTLVTGLALENETSAPTVYGYSNTTTSLQNPQQVGFNESAITLTNTSRAKIDSVGVYALDTMKFGKKWELSLGTRFDNLRTNYTQKTSTATTVLSRTDNLFSYSGGLIYKPKRNGSVYFSYGTSFNPSAESLTLSSTANAGTANVEPEQNTVYELGTKWDFFKKRLSTAFAVFRSEKDNARETNIFGGQDSTLSGKQRVYGFTAQASGSITDAWKIMTSYSYMDGEITHSANAYLKNRSLFNVPEHTFSLFSNYRFESKLELGGGANFVSERFAGSSSTGAAYNAASGTFRNVPSYLVFNAFARYPLMKGIDLQLNIFNLTNEYYLDQVRGANAAVPGDGRTVMLTTSFSF